MTGNKESFVGTIGFVLLILTLFVFGGTVIPAVLGALIVFFTVFFTHRQEGDFESLFEVTFQEEAAVLLLLLLKLFGTIGDELSPAAAAIVTAETFLIPILYAGIYSMYLGNGDRCGFSGFYRKVMQLFAIGYSLFMIFWYFIFNVVYVEGGVGGQLIPFATFSGYIEAIIRGTIPVSLFVLYMVFIFVVFIPVGFIIGLFLQNFPFWVRTTSVFALPLVLEAIRFLMGLNNFDIDNVIFGFAGGVLGILIFALADKIFMNTTGNGLLGNKKRGLFI